MKLENLVAVSGLPGLFKMAVNRPNGLIVEDLMTGKKKFAPSRKHQFTPLESISIYTYTDTTPLADVFKKMKESDTPPTNAASTQELMDYFRGILPDFDEDRVYQSDVKKIVKWFSCLNDLKMLEEDAEEEKSEEKEAEVVEEKKEEKS